MTYAVCLFCGKSKIGAITECVRCGKAGTGNFDLDITFSDRRMTRKTLKKFGKIIQSIRNEADGDDELQMGTFLKYVSDNYPDILTVNAVESTAINVEKLLDQLGLPVFDVDSYPLNERHNRRGWKLRW